MSATHYSYRTDFFCTAIWIDACENYASQKWCGPKCCNSFWCDLKCTNFNWYIDTIQSIQNHSTKLQNFNPSIHQSIHGVVKLNIKTKYFNTYRNQYKSHKSSFKKCVKLFGLYPLHWEFFHQLFTNL